MSKPKFSLAPKGTIWVELSNHLTIRQFYDNLTGMPRSVIKSLKYLDIEEKILNFGSIIAAIGVFMPWFGGEWFGEPTVWTGFGFYTSFVGLIIFLAHLFIISLTALPLLGYQLIRPSLRDVLRLIVGLECVVLVIVVWSILTNISIDRANVDIRFGIYLTLVGSIIVSLYAFLRVQQQRKRNVQELFHHPEDEVSHSACLSSPPPPPPPPSKPEEPKLFS